jgi:hypothetical protein
MIAPRHLETRAASARPWQRPAQRHIRRRDPRHRMARGRRTTTARALSPTGLWLDDRRALPLKWGLLALLLLGVALLEGPL